MSCQPSGHSALPGLDSGWDPEDNATISTISFAGPSAGNAEFAALSNAQLGPRCNRIYNTLDIIPAGWATETLKALPGLYACGGIKMSFILKLVYMLLYATLRGYQQVDNGNLFTWTNQPVKDDYIKQAGVQHFDSYPIVLGVPELLDVIEKK